MKIVSNQMLKSATSKVVTEVIIEGTDAAYSLENGALTMAEMILRNVIAAELLDIAGEVLGKFANRQSGNA